MVVDASAMAELLLRQPRAHDIQAAMAGRAGAIHAPQLLDLEVLQVLRRNVLANTLDETLADEYRGRLARFPVERHSHTSLASQIWALRHNMTTYDASYVALAMRLGCALLTTDFRLARAAEGLVELALGVG